MEQSNENLTEWLPPVRVTPEMKAKLRVKTQSGAGRNMSDHIRYAVELYIEANEKETEETRDQVPA